MHLSGLLGAASILAVLSSGGSAFGQTAPQVGGPTPADGHSSTGHGSTPFHREGVAFLDLSPGGIGTQAGVSWGRDWQVGAWAGTYLPWPGNSFGVAVEGYASFAYQWGDPGLYTALYIGAGTRLPDPGHLSLRSFAIVTTTHRVSLFGAATVFWTPRNWYPGSLTDDSWFFSFRFGPTAVVVPGRIKVQGYVELPYVPGVPLGPPAPGFIVLVFF